MSILKFLSTVAFCMVSELAFAKDHGGYPCNVFSSNFCFRAPPTTVVKTSTPADFLINEIFDGETLLATIYIGSDVDAAVKKFDKHQTAFGSLAISFIRKEGNDDDNSNELNVVFFDKKGEPFAHLLSLVKDKHINRLIELTSSIRPCTPIRSGGQSCKISAAWSSLIVNAVNGS